jgi:alpha-L-fucosidase
MMACDGTGYAGGAHDATFGYPKDEVMVLKAGKPGQLMERGNFALIRMDTGNGANEVRHIDRKTYYDWDSTFKLVYSLQPDIIIFSDAGPGCRWIGNERGIAGETNWSTIKADSLTIGGSDQNYLNTGDPDGTEWITGECDVSIRPGWFYHSSQDSLVKSMEELREIYYGSVGRNAVLLLNIPPDQRGLIHENDVQRLKEFSNFISSTFEQNLAAGIQFSETVELPEPVSFDLIVLGENISEGQRVHAFTIEAWQDGEWKSLTAGSTIGYKRILKTDLTTTSKLKFSFESEKGPPLITTFGIYREHFHHP